MNPTLRTGPRTQALPPEGALNLAEATRLALPARTILADWTAPQPPSELQQGFTALVSAVCYLSLCPVEAGGREVASTLEAIQLCHDLAAEIEADAFSGNAGDHGFFEPIWQRKQQRWERYAAAQSDTRFIKGADRRTFDEASARWWSRWWKAWRGGPRSQTF